MGRSLVVGQPFNPYGMGPGTIVFDWVMAIPNLCFAAKFLYCRLARYNGRNNQCFPRLETLGLEMGLSVSAVSRHLKSLADAGMIRRRKYTLHGPVHTVFLLCEPFLVHLRELPTSGVTNCPEVSNELPRSEQFGDASEGAQSRASAASRAKEPVPKTLIEDGQVKTLNSESTDRNGKEHVFLAKPPPSLLDILSEEMRSRLGVRPSLSMWEREKFQRLAAEMGLRAQDAVATYRRALKDDFWRQTASMGSPLRFLTNYTKILAAVGALPPPDALPRIGRRRSRP